MILFWAILVLMVLAALAFVVPPLLGRGSVVGPQRAGVHRVLFRKRLAELETDLADDALSPGQFDQARADLERDTLEALESADADAARPARRARARRRYGSPQRPRVRVRWKGRRWCWFQGLRSSAISVPARRGKANICSLLPFIFR